ncbi:MAG: radical SAM protein [Candidatus Omnitrophica bacterium]|nr:radical SAM protein [Candidatus Omnitrophota bacterium]
MIKNNLPENCCRSYFGMWIVPTRFGKAMVSTCCHNKFMRENRVIVDNGIKNAWNSMRFQFQRKLISQRNWSFCWGASCGIDPFTDDLTHINIPEVKDAIEKKRRELNYCVKKLVLSLSFDCNNNCHFCYYRHQRRRKNSYQLQDNLIKEIKGIIPDVRKVILSGGEPFFSSRSCELIEWILAEHPQKEIVILTNGTLLHKFGLRRLMRQNIILQVSMYAMNKNNHHKITGVNNFEIMFRNVNALIKDGFGNLILVFLVSLHSKADLEDFCRFIEQNENVKGIVRNNVFESKLCEGIMKTMESKYSYLNARLRFIYMNESIQRKISRKLYNPVHSLRYMLTCFFGKLNG